MLSWIYFTHSFKRNRPLKMQFFQFCNFFFSTLDPFSEKTYEKTCHFYNIFWKSISNCTHLRSFTLWIFFSKILWLFQFNGHFFLLCTTFARKLVKRPNNFMTDFQSSYRYVHALKFLSSDIFLKKYGSPFKMLTIYY